MPENIENNSDLPDLPDNLKQLPDLPSPDFFEKPPLDQPEETNEVFDTPDILKEPPAIPSSLTTATIENSDIPKPPPIPPGVTRERPYTQEEIDSSEQMARLDSMARLAEKYRDLEKKDSQLQPVGSDNLSSTPNSKMQFRSNEIVDRLIDANKEDRISKGLRPIEHRRIAKELIDKNSNYNEFLERPNEIEPSIEDRMNRMEKLLEKILQELENARKQSNPE